MKLVKSLIIACVFFCSAAFADVDSLNQLLQSFQSLQANFVQSVSDNQGVVGDQQSGTLMIQKPNQFRWEVTAPNAQLFISDGKSLWNVEPDLEQATRSPLTQNLSTTPLLLLSGNVTDLHKIFAVTQVGVGQYRLVPTDNDSLIKSVTLVFDHNTIEKISVLNTMGQTAVVTFSQVRFNVAVPSNSFVYKPGQGMQVLTQ